jgi:hypothetical protein
MITFNSRADNTKKDVFGNTDLDREYRKFSGKYCEIPGCKEGLTFRVAEFSMKKYGKLLCFKHQREGVKQ